MDSPHVIVSQGPGQGTLLLLPAHSYICFIHNIQDFQLGLEGGRGQVQALHLPTAGVSSCAGQDRGVKELIPQEQPSTNDG